MVVNATRGVVVYNPSNSATKGTLAGSVLTLDFDTTSHADADVLQIFTDDADTGATEQTLARLAQVMEDLSKRLDVYPDGAGALRTNITNATVPVSGALTGVTTVTTVTGITNVGTGATNLDNLWKPLFEISVQQQNSLFPVT